METIIFLWIPKTAGTSIYNLFKKEGMIKHKFGLKNKTSFNIDNYKLITFGHANLIRLQEENILKSDFKYKF